MCVKSNAKFLNAYQFQTLRYLWHTLYKVSSKLSSGLFEVCEMKVIHIIEFKHIIKHQSILSTLRSHMSILLVLVSVIRSFEIWQPWPWVHLNIDFVHSSFSCLVWITLFYLSFYKNNLLVLSCVCLISDWLPALVSSLSLPNISTIFYKCPFKNKHRRHLFVYTHVLVFLIYFFKLLYKSNKWGKGG